MYVVVWVANGYGPVYGTVRVPGHYSREATPLRTRCNKRNMASQTPGSSVGSGRGKPSLFNSELFGSPAPTGTAGGLSSLGLGDDIFSSPFSLAPAAPVEQKQSPTATPPSRSPRRSPEPSRSAQPTVGTQSIVDGGDQGELSTIPLDSPSLAQMSTASSIPMAGSAGWNDPPVLSQFSTPQRSSSQPPPGELGSTLATTMTSSNSASALANPVLDRSDSYPVQPLAGRNMDVTSSAPPGPPATQSSSSNPYRMGGAAKRSTTLGYAMNQPPPSIPALSSLPPPQPQVSQQPPPPPPPAAVSSAAALPATIQQPQQQPPFELQSQYQQQQQNPGVQYSMLPVRSHWFYLRNNERYWFPFSLIDSGRLEEALIRSQANPTQEVSISIICISSTTTITTTTTLM